MSSERKTLSNQGDESIFCASEKLVRLIETYQKSPGSRELLSRFTVAYWKEAGNRIGKNFQVDNFPLTSQDLIEKQNEGLMAIFVPQGITRDDLLRIYPKMGMYATCQRLSIDNIRGLGCWLWIEASSTNLRKTLDSRDASKGVFGQSLRTYIVGGQISKLLTGRYFDEKGLTVSELLGHQPWERRILIAGFNSDGHLSTWSREEWSCRGAICELKISGYRTEPVIASSHPNP